MRARNIIEMSATDIRKLCSFAGNSTVRSSQKGPSTTLCQRAQYTSRIFSRTRLLATNAANATAAATRPFPLSRDVNTPGSRDVMRWPRRLYLLSKIFRSLRIAKEFVLSAILGPAESCNRIVKWRSTYTSVYTLCPGCPIPSDFHLLSEKCKVDFFLTGIPRNRYVSS